MLDFQPSVNSSWRNDSKNAPPELSYKIHIQKIKKKMCVLLMSGRKSAFFFYNIFIFDTTIM